MGIRCARHAIRGKVIKIVYARWGPDSDVFLFGGVEHSPPDDVHVVTCCGCLLIREDPDDWLMSPSLDFRTKEALLAHLAEHREAGHVVPEFAVKRIREDTWI